MRRFVLGFVVLALVAIGVRTVDAQAATTARPSQRATVAQMAPTSVALYGDSLAAESRAAFSARMARRAPGELTVSTFPGTALCDYRTEIVTELVARRPQVVMLEFSGNSLTDCMSNERGELLRIGSDSWRARYLDDVRAVLQIADTTDTLVVWATAPPVDHAGDPEDYPRALATSMRAVAADDPHLVVADTGAALTTDGHSFRTTLPCRSDERGLCVDGRINVRSDDGLHFDCHGAVAVRTACAGYSAGARRFGEALADAAIAAG